MVTLRDFFAHMGPQRDFRGGDVSPQDIQPLVPGIERDVIGTLEARARQPQHLQVVAVPGPDYRTRDMRGVRNPIRRRHIKPRPHADPRGIASPVTCSWPHLKTCKTAGGRERQHRTQRSETGRPGKEPIGREE